MNIIKKPDWYCIGIILFTLFGCFLFTNHILWVFEDIGREWYFPIQMLQGKILYKDIFNLFGPFSYMLNAVIFKFFGSGFSVISYIGYISALLVTLGIYKLSECFLNKKYAFLTAVFVATLGTYNFLNFRYTIPYTYAILYSMIAFIWSLYYFVKSEKTSKVFYLYISALLSGIAACSKYEYFLYAIFVAGWIIYFYRNNIKHLLLLLLTIMIPSAACFGYLFISGLTCSDIVNSMQMIKAISVSDGYNTFYGHIGALFSYFNFKICFNSAIQFLIIYLLFLYADTIKKQNKPFIIIGFLYFINFYVILRYIHNYGSNFALCFLTLAVLVLTVINFKNLGKVQKFVCISVLLSSLKVFWACYIFYYGIFFFPVLLVAIYILIDKQAFLKRVLSILLVCIMVTVLYENTSDFAELSIPVKGFEKPVYSTIERAWSVNSIIKYINNNTKTTDKVIVYPDGLTINYLTGRASDNIYYSLEPPYLTMCGENNLIEHYKKDRPEYFIFSDKDMSVYGKKKMCVDYAAEFCKFVKTDYTKVQEIQYDKDSIKYEIYRLKDLT